MVLRRRTMKFNPEELRSLAYTNLSMRPLTIRQKEIWRHIALGQKTVEIAKTLRISVKTVETHIARLKKRTGCRNTSDLTRAAIIAGLITPTQTV